jgi:3'-phosphoadenosine 5'-phosphosulfate sulfotransferase
MQIPKPSDIVRQRWVPFVKTLIRTQSDIRNRRVKKFNAYMEAISAKETIMNPKPTVLHT